jgi:rod shape-determining protein MreC
MSRKARPLRRVRFRTVLPVLLILSAGLLVLSRLEHSAVREVRWHIAELMTPVLSAILVPLEPLRWVGQHVTKLADLTRELDDLKDENQRLRSWEWRAHELERKVGELTALSKVVRETPLEFVTVRVIANSSGAFVRSAMINAGTDQRLKSGYPVLSGDGLVGRVLETGRSAARVLFLTDLNSRIPVLVGRDGVRAVLVGDNGPSPRLAYALSGAHIAPGDEVATSGIGGLFPRGLRIGVVVETARGLRVRPHANLDRVEYLSILFYEAPSPDLAAVPERDGIPVAAEAGASASLDGGRDKAGP